MALALEAHKQHFAAQVFERGKKLFGLLDAATQIIFTVNNQQRRVLAGQRGSSRVFAIPSEGAGRGPHPLRGRGNNHAQAVSRTHV